MKTKLCRPILVESKEYSIIHKFGDCLDTHAELQKWYVDAKPIYQNLILISLDPDEKIEGDYYDEFTKKIYNTGGAEYGKATFCHNIIATQSQLSLEPQKYISADGQGGQVSVHWEEWNDNKLPLISPEYIQQFIEEYNKSEVKDVEIEMEEINNYSDTNRLEDIVIFKPKLTNGFVTIVEKSDIEKQADLVEKVGFKNLKHKELKQSEDNWEAKLAIKNIPELPHIINSVRELRRYYIDGIQIGYNVRKNEESIASIDDKILYWAKALEHKSLSLKELMESAKFLLNKINYTEKEVEELIFRYNNDLLDSIDPIIDSFDGENAIDFSKEWFINNKK